MLDGLYAQFGTNQDLEKNGVEIRYPAKEKDKQDAVFIVRCPGGSNVEFNASLDRARTPYADDIASGRLSEEKAQEIYKEAFLDSCLIGWSGIKDQAGNDMQFTVENARRLFNLLPRLFQDLRTRASSISTYQDGTLGAEAKN